MPIRPTAPSRTDTAELVIGVTGHLLLSAAERERVVTQASAQMEALLTEEPRPHHVRLVSGLAPGADLVLTEAILAGCERAAIPCHLTAAIVDSPEDLLQRWKQRATALGAELTPATVEHVAQRISRLLLRADQQLRFITPDHSPDQGFHQLAALLAESAEVLFAVLRAQHPDAAGGAAQTLQWWTDSGLIPAVFRLGPVTRGATNRRLVRIDPGDPHPSTLRHVVAEVGDIRDHLRAGNALTASDIALRALGQHPQHSLLRYLYLLSLANCGSTARALRLYPQLVPDDEDEFDEDWAALHGRLYKDLAFAGIDVADNLARAAEHYERAYERSQGTFSAVNAATMHALAGHGEAAMRLAQAVRAHESAPLPADESGRYYHFASQAEALAVLGDWDGCRAALAQADPLLRNDLLTRARTRAQLSQLVRAAGADADVVNGLAMPSIYVLEPCETGYPAAVPDDLARRLRDSPTFALHGETGWGCPERPLRQLLDLGVRLHLVDGDPAGQGDPLAGAERRVRMNGFRADEVAWYRWHAQRHLYGLAGLTAQQLQVEVRRVRVDTRADAEPRWVLDAPAPPRAMSTSGGRRLVGLVFTDLVGFSAYDDLSIELYWRVVVPRLAECLEPYRDDILLQRTWGDAIHLVTADAVTAARASQDMLAAIRTLRRELDGQPQRLEMRVGAHFAPAWHGDDAIEAMRTYYGSQLSLTARVEPVTPPGMTYVTEEFASEVVISAPDEFRLEYAGEVPLAKKYGRFRLYSLRPARAAPDEESPG